MADGPGHGTRLPVTLRSPERHRGTVAFVLLALLAGWYFVVRHGSAAGVTTGSVLAAALLVTAWRVHHARLIADSHGLTDYRAIRIVYVNWDDIAGFDIARPAGPWGGVCVRALQGHRDTGSVQLQPDLPRPIDAVARPRLIPYTHDLFFQPLITHS